MRRNTSQWHKTARPSYTHALWLHEPQGPSEWGSIYYTSHIAICPTGSVMKVVAPLPLPQTLLRTSAEKQLFSAMALQCCKQENAARLTRPFHEVSIEMAVIQMTMSLVSGAKATS